MHGHRYLIRLVFFAAVLISAAVISAATVNVDFGIPTADFPVYSGTAMAPDAGTYWNPVGNTQSSVANFSDSLGNATSLGVEFDTSSHIIQMCNWYEPQLAPNLMRDYVYGNYGAVDRLWITGLDPARIYDLYLYSQNGVNCDCKTRFTVGGVNKTVTNTGNASNFALGSNYTVFNGVSPGDDGRLAVQYQDMKGVSSAFNGFQLIGEGFSTVTELGEPSRGRQILLNRGLQLAVCEPTPSFDFDVNRWLSANFTTINFVFDGNMHQVLLPRLPKGHQWARWYGGLDITPTEMSYIDDMVSFQYWDEMDGQFGKKNVMEILPEVAAKYSEWNSLYPNTMTCTSFWGGQLTASQLRTYLRTTKPDLLTYEAFPGFFGTRETWYEEMQKFRTVALEGYDGTGRQPVPYFQQTQASRTAYREPLPCEAFVRQQQFASWAFGFTGITQWLYRDPLLFAAPGQDELLPQMFSFRGDASPTPMFDYVAETNRQSRNLGPAIIRMVSADIRIIPGKIDGQVKPSISGIPTWIEGGQNTGGYRDFITDIVPLGKDHNNPDYNNYCDTLVGYFRPLLPENPGFTFVDGLCFMIVNGNAGDTNVIVVNGQPFNAMGMSVPVDANGAPDPEALAAGTAEALGEWFHVAFDFHDSNIDSLVRLSRETGEVEVIPLQHYADSRYYMTLYLPGGTGDLFAYWDSNTPLPTITKGLRAGDADGDGVVDADDAAILAANWLKRNNASWSDGDFNGDGVVDAADATLLAANWWTMGSAGPSNTTISGVSVAEPSTIILLAGMLFGCRLIKLVSAYITSNIIHFQENACHE